MSKTNHPNAPITLKSLVAAVGRADTSLLDAVLDGATPTELTELGREIDSSRIFTDATRIYAAAYDFWSKATPAQKDHLRGFSPELLALAVHQAYELQQKYTAQASDGHADDVARAAQDAGARASAAAGLVLRDQVYQVLRGVAGKDATLRAQVDAAVGTAEDGEALARGLDQLTAVGHEFLAKKTGPLAERAKLARLDAGYLATLEAAAEDVRSHSGTHARLARGRNAQGEIDHADGVNLHLLGQVIHAFEAAHDRDGTIPRLVPIATRRLLGHHSGSARREAPAPASGAGTGAAVASGGATKQ